MIIIWRSFWEAWEHKKLLTICMRNPSQSTYLPIWWGDPLLIAADPLLGHRLKISPLLPVGSLITGHRDVLTNDYWLRLAFYSNSCTCASGNLYPVLDTWEQPTNYYRSNGCIHSFVDMESRFIPQAPDLQKCKARNKKNIKLSFLSNWWPIFLVVTDLFSWLIEVFVNDIF